MIIINKQLIQRTIKVLNKTFDGDINIKFKNDKMILIKDGFLAELTVSNYQDINVDFDVNIKQLNKMIKVYQIKAHQKDKISYFSVHKDNLMYSINANNFTESVKICLNT